jgi:hypothetical protein
MKGSEEMDTQHSPLILIPTANKVILRVSDCRSNLQQSVQIIAETSLITKGSVIYLSDSHRHFIGQSRSRHKFVRVHHMFKL